MLWFHPTRHGPWANLKPKFSLHPPPTGKELNPHWAQISGLIPNSISLIRVQLKAYCRAGHGALPSSKQLVTHTGLARDLCLLWPNQDTMVFNGTVTLLGLQNRPCRALTFPAIMVSHLHYSKLKYIEVTFLSPRYFSISLQQGALPGAVDTCKTFLRL